MKPTQFLFAAFLWLGCGSVFASVDLQFVSQSRSVTAENHSYYVNDAESVSAPDWGPFDATARVSWEYPWEPSSSTETKEYFAVAQQTSDFTPEVIAANGSAEEKGPFDAYVHHLQFAHSDLQVVFTLPNSGTWFLSADLYARGDYGGTNKGWYEASIQLSRGTETIFSVHQYGAPGADPSVVSWPEIHLGENLPLAAGTYTLDGHASASCFYTPDYEWPGTGGGGGASYHVSLHEVPGPAAVPLTLCGLGLVAFLRKRVLR